MKSFIGNFFHRSRTLDPTTSHQAAEEIKTVAPIHMQRIHECLHEHGPLGKDGIARLTGMHASQIARRLPEMQKMNLVKETGFLVPSDSGRNEREWSVV